MTDWTTKRRVSLVIHLLLVLIPVVAALIAGINLWTWVLGSAWLAVPVIVSLEGVAVIGFIFKLTNIESPLVQARHIIPFYSLATLAYELGIFLMARLDVYAGLGFTFFLLAVFGTLFVKLFGTIERLFITEIEAAKEKAKAEMHAILVRVEKFNAESEVFNQATLKLRDAEQKRFEVMQRQQLLGLPGGSDDDAAELRRLLEQRTRELENAQNEAEKRGRVIANLARPKETVTLESQEGATFQVEVPAPVDQRPDLARTLMENGVQPERVEPSLSLASFLEEAGMSAVRARAMVSRYTNGTAGDAYRKLKNFGYLPDGLTLQSFGRLFDELMAGDAEVTSVITADGDERPVFQSDQDADGLPDELPFKTVELKFEGDGTEFTLQGIEVPVADACGFCSKPISASDKSVSRRSFWKKRLDGKDACDECRENRR